MTDKYAGSLWPSDNSTEYNELVFQVRSLLMKCNTCLPVKVISSQATGVAPVGFVNIEILVTQLSGDSQTVDNPIVTNVPYFRLQGGSNAVIIDPKVGDIGLACFCSRDISAIKRAKKKAPPGSLRTFSVSDAVYIGGILNGTPSQYIHFTDNGIVVYSPTKLTVQAPEVLIDASSNVTIDTPVINVTGQINQTGTKGSGSSMTGGITNTGGNISSNGIVLDSHVHDGVTPGGGETGRPV